MVVTWTRPRHTKYRDRSKISLLKIWLLCGICLFSLAVFFYNHLSTQKPAEIPHYHDYHEYEQQLSQYDSASSATGDEHTKYLFFANHAHGVGWGNVMQELILNAHLAYVANRSFVFYNYTWDWQHDIGMDREGEPVPGTIPISAFLSGPVVGSPFHRAIAEQAYRKICPKATVLSTDLVYEPSKGDPDTDVSILRWTEILKATSDPCVEISGRQIFDIWTFGDTRVLTPWSELRKSPILTQFGWSDLVVSAFEANQHLFLKPSYYQFPPFIPMFPPYPARSQSAPIPGLLAMHLRRSDFEAHCKHLHRWRSTFNGFNRFPSFIDQFTPRKDGEAEEVDEWKYMKACYPEIEDIVEKVRDVRATPVGKNVTRVHIMSNGDPQWLKELAKALKREPGLVKVSNSQDLKFTNTQKHVAVAVDMFIAQRAQVFIGNGWSSLTSSTNMLRMARGFPPESIRFF